MMVCSGLVVGAAVLVPAATNAAAYRARLRWQPSADSVASGYRVYTRSGSGAFALALDAGMPATASDGTLAVVTAGLDSCKATGFTVTAYHPDGSETGVSNEIVLTAAQVGARIDSDDDGLADGVEDRDHDCVVDAGETDPGRADTDGDGVADAGDACQGTFAGAVTNPAGCSCVQIACDDDNACNGVETCDAGVCQVTAAPNCDDGNACTEDSCSPRSGCRHARVAGCRACTSDTQCDDGDVCTADTCIGGRCTETAVADCCERDRDCADPDACHANPRCEAGRCVADAVVCADPGPCASAVCDPQAGCTTTPLPDGTACGDGGVGACSQRVCSAGVCGDGGPAVPTGDAGEGDGKTRLTLKATANGLQVLARASLEGFPAVDLPDHEVLFTVRDGGGAIVFETRAAGSAFDVTRGLWTFRDDHRDDGGGFTHLELRHQDTASALTLRALVPPAAGERRAKVASAGAVEWSVRSPDRCVDGSGRCRRRGRKCR